MLEGVKRITTNQRTGLCVHSSLTSAGKDKGDNCLLYDNSRDMQWGLGFYKPREVVLHIST